MARQRSILVAALRAEMAQGRLAFLGCGSAWPAATIGCARKACPAGGPPGVRRLKVAARRLRNARGLKEREVATAPELIFA